MQIQCVRSFDYLTAGATYTVTVGKRFANFTNNRTGGGTLLAIAVYRNAFRVGYLVPFVTREEIREKAGC